MEAEAGEPTWSSCASLAGPISSTTFASPSVDAFALAQYTTCNRHPQADHVYWDAARHLM